MSACSARFILITCLLQREPWSLPSCRLFTSLLAKNNELIILRMVSQIPFSMLWQLTQDKLREKILSKLPRQFC